MDYKDSTTINEEVELPGVPAEDGQDAGNSTQEISVEISSEELPVEVGADTSALAGDEDSTKESDAADIAEVEEPVFAPGDTVSGGSSEQILNSLEDLSQKVDGLKKLFMEKIRYSEHEEKIIDQMHKELQKYKEDMYAQLIRPVLLDIIDVRDSILRISAIYLDKPEGERDIPNKTFAGYALEIQDILEKNGIEIYRSNPGDAFVPVKQRAIKKVATANEELHGRVVESFSCGYTYNNRIISPEKIAVYSFEETAVAETKNEEDK